MPNCAKCGKSVGFFSTKSDFSGNYFCSDDCKNKFHNKIKKEKEIKSKGMIEEIKCKCNQCGKIWHYLESDEKRLKGQAVGNLLVGGGMCCNPFGTLFLNKSIEASREAEKLKKCPNCNSTDITKTPVYHEKRA